MKSMKDKIVLITGAGSGIGSATVEAFAKLGAVVVGVDKNKNSVNKKLFGCIRIIYL